LQWDLWQAKEPGVGQGGRGKKVSSDKELTEVQDGGRLLRGEEKVANGLVR
jgi:hypothetical protein